jgi:uncharacterized protein
MTDAARSANFVAIRNVFDGNCSMAGLTIITGASAGLGEKFAEALAAPGAALLISARRVERLEALAERLRAKGATVEIVAADLRAHEGTAPIIAAIAGRPVATLINNAGVGARGGFAELDGTRQVEMVRLNCMALLELCHAVLPGMIAAKSGGILNVASTAAFQPGPWMATYYATKAFVLSLSEALHEEVKEHGVRIACLCPGATRTEFAGEADMTDSFLFKTFAGDADAVVRDGLNALQSNQAVKISGVVNWLMMQSNRVSPRFAVRKIAGSMQR